MNTVEVITRQSELDRLISRFLLSQHFEKIVIELKALVNPTDEEIRKVLGYVQPFSLLNCDECGSSFDKGLCFRSDDDPYYNVTLCPACIAKAMELLKWNIV